MEQTKDTITMTNEEHRAKIDSAHRFYEYEKSVAKSEWFTYGFFAACGLYFVIKVIEAIASKF